MKLEVGQKWVSESNPHEDFEIYDGCEDDFVLSDLAGNHYNSKFEDLPESAKIYFWRRTNDEAFDKFIVSKKGENYDSTYPFAWSGECKRHPIVSKIKKFGMKLSEVATCKES
jgi:hypothetical protein